ncbi:MAG: tRNA (adenosine(37)-N6)-threonylcarbamoyltransferase complex dimerization subunit type 1 TsaB [Sulfitobacter sp.]
MREPSLPSILAFDTSAAHCAAAVFARGALLHSRTEEMAKGQAERILTLSQDILAQCGLELNTLTAIAVGVGPGNFTGIRISVSAARGLALALGIPAIPVSTFEVLRDPSDIQACQSELVIVGAPRGAAYAQPFSHGRPTAEPQMIDPTAPPDAFRTENLRVTGHMAADIAALLGADAAPSEIRDPAGHIARIAAWKIAQGHDTTVPPAPLYVRAADAAPPRDAPPRIIA